METIYRLNTKDLGIGFVNSVKVAYPDQSIEITVREEEDPDFDETEYLLSSPANREHLDKSMKELAEGKVISFENVEQAMQAARERSAKL